MVDVSTQQRGAVALAPAGQLQAATTKAPGRKQRLFFWLPLAWLAVVTFTAIFAPWLGLPDPDEIDFINPQTTPNAEHWFGTDVLGRDILARTIFGARVSLTVGFAAPGLGMIFGLILGMLAGYYRGRLETVVVASIDTLLAVPGLVVLLLFSLIFGGSLATVSIGLGILFVPVFTRVSRANTLNFAQRDFVLAARALGASDSRIIMREIFPNVVLPVLAFALVGVATAIVVEGALSFLGLSVQSPQPSWGGTIAEGREHLEETPHISIIPSAVMFLTVLSFNLVGDNLRRRFADVRASVL